MYLRTKVAAEVAMAIASGGALSAHAAAPVITPIVGTPTINLSAISTPYWMKVGGVSTFIKNVLSTTASIGNPTGTFVAGGNSNSRYSWTGGTAAQNTIGTGNTVATLQQPNGSAITVVTTITSLPIGVAQDLTFYVGNYEAANLTGSFQLSGGPLDVYTGGPASVSTYNEYSIKYTFTPTAANQTVTFILNSTGGSDPGGNPAFPAHYLLAATLTPEPSSLGMLAVGGAALLGRRWRRRA